MYHPTHQKVTVDNYPYGRLRTTMTYWIEFKAKKGFRLASQTVNPKNGRINKPHYSTYSPFMVLQTKENGHVVPFTGSFNGAEAINRSCGWLALNGHLFSENEIKDLYAQIITAVRVEIWALTKFSGAKTEDAIKLVDDSMKEALKGFETGDVAFFHRIVIDLEKSKEICDPNYKPFGTP